jgi:hypothetical protein
MFVPEIALADLMADPLPGAAVVADLQQGLGLWRFGGGE